MAYTWPGNVRELENFVERMVNLQDDTHIADVSALVRGAQAATSSNAASDADCADVVSLAEAERRAIEQALRASDCNMTRCAIVLGVSKPALYAKLKRHVIRLQRTMHGAVQ
jgi:DNA-binding NtrC family response regulator